MACGLHGAPVLDGMHCASSHILEALLCNRNMERAWNILQMKTIRASDKRGNLQLFDEMRRAVESAWYGSSVRRKAVIGMRTSPDAPSSSQRSSKRLFRNRPPLKHNLSPSSRIVLSITLHLISVLFWGQSATVHGQKADNQAPMESHMGVKTCSRLR